MIHNLTSQNIMGNHYGVSFNDNFVLAQLQEDGQQARVPLSPVEARYMAKLLIEAADKVEGNV